MHSDMFPRFTHCAIIVDTKTVTRYLKHELEHGKLINFSLRE